MTVVGSSFGDVLVENDASTVPAEPPDDILYHHKVRYFASVRNLWSHREIIYTLAERDFRAQYKQAVLGVLWAVLGPVATLLIFVVVFSHVKTFGSQGLPYALYAFVGLLCWGFFATALGTGGQSLLNNKAPHGQDPVPPRVLSPGDPVRQRPWVPDLVDPPDPPLRDLRAGPKLATLWCPIFIVIEIVFAAGVAMAVASIIIQMRDLMQVLPIITSLGLFATPVIWPFSEIPTNYHVAGGTLVRTTHLVHGHIVHASHYVGGFTINLQMVYGFFNPLGPIIANARNTMLLGYAPEWNLVGIAALGALLYLMLGYRIFKKLEVNFADIA